MLVIRLSRVSKKNQPIYQVVVTDKKNPPKGGRFVEKVGSFSPLTKQKVLKKERIKYWLSVGAKPSVTVYNLLVREGVIVGKKRPAHKKPKEKKQEAKEPLKTDKEAPKETQKVEPSKKKNVSQGDKA